MGRPAHPHCRSGGQVHCGTARFSPSALLQWGFLDIIIATTGLSTSLTLSHAHEQDHAQIHTASFNWYSNVLHLTSSTLESSTALHTAPPPDPHRCCAAPHLLFDGIFKEHAVLVSDGIQAVRGTKRVLATRGSGSSWKLGVVLGFCWALCRQLLNTPVLVAW